MSDEAAYPAGVETPWSWRDAYSKWTSPGVHLNSRVGFEAVNEVDWPQYLSGGGSRADAVRPDAAGRSERLRSKRLRSKRVCLAVASHLDDLSTSDHLP